MIQYATPEELAAYLDPDAAEPVVPPLATVLIRSASQLVLDATAAAVYDTDENGLPTKAAYLDAMRDATCEQASAWSLNGIDPRKGASQVARRVASKALNGAQVSYVADPKADSYLSDLASGEALTLAAWRILDNAGLISNRVATGGANADVWPLRTQVFDPLTGDVEP